MEAIPAKLTTRMIEEMDALVADGWFANRSEMIRDAVKLYFEREAERPSIIRIHYVQDVVIAA